MTTDNTQDKYTFFIEIQDGAGGLNRIEWTDLTERTAKTMYNTTIRSCHTWQLNSHGWAVQK